MATLYRKYRSQTFDEMIGQEPIVTTLINQIKITASLIDFKQRHARTVERVGDERRYLPREVTQCLPQTARTA